jgi:RNA polymerase sigma-70 factor
LTDNRTRPVTNLAQTQTIEALLVEAVDVNEIYSRCSEIYPGLTLPREDLKNALVRAVVKYLVGLNNENKTPAVDEIRTFIGELQDRDLFLTLACAHGCEQAWWQFDRLYRSFIERLSRQLVGRGMDANEVIDSVYVELYGTKHVNGVRQSKFRTYTGRGTLKGWLRTVISHTAVDLYRGKQNEIPLEEWTKSGDEVSERSTLRTKAYGSEAIMLEDVARERYRSMTSAALDRSLAALDSHETLLLLYYHVEGLKLREIAQIVEAPSSSIRRWFQKRSTREGASTRIHESTVMRWLEKIYKKVADRFRSELKDEHGLNPSEIEICLEIATEDFGQGVNLNLDKVDLRNIDQTEGAS